jgi:hypothetical protein
MTYRCTSFAPSLFWVLPFVQRGAVHEKQMPFMAAEGDCPPAPSKAPVCGVHWSKRKPLTEEAGGSGAGFSQEGQEITIQCE